MKTLAIIVDKLPECCTKCNYYNQWGGYDGYDKCNAKNETIMGDGEKREKDCPLRLKPKQKEAVTKEQTSKYDYICHVDPYAAGYNDCLNEILGGTKNDRTNGSYKLDLLWSSPFTF